MLRNCAITAPARAAFCETHHGWGCEVAQHLRLADMDSQPYPLPAGCERIRMTTMLTCLRAVTIALLLIGPASLNIAQELSGDDMRSLDDQVQEIKSDVLGIASELNNLEERLLYPSNTQVAVFIAIARDETFRLDAVQIEIDGELAAHHIYSFNELEALKKGGVQRIYTGNVATGEHQMSIAVIGKLKNGDDFTQSDTIAFAKRVEPKILGVTLAGNGIDVGDW
jgi:hypothetical protein